MARLRYVSKDELAPEYQGILKHPSNLNRIFGNSPACRLAHHPIAAYLRDVSRLDPRLRELAVIEVGYLTNCAYEWVHHVKIGLASGLSEADVRAVSDFNEGGASHLDQQALAILKAAREMTLAAGLSEETFAALRTFLEDDQLFDLLAAIAHYNGAVRLINSLNLDIEADYLGYLEKFPLSQSRVLPPMPGLG